jgi:hypothetical protein
MLPNPPGPGWHLAMRATYERSRPIVPRDPEQPGTTLTRPDVFHPGTVLRASRRPCRPSSATPAVFCHSIHPPSLLQPARVATR